MLELIECITIQPTKVDTTLLRSSNLSQVAFNKPVTIALVLHTS